MMRNHSRNKSKVRKLIRALAFSSLTLATLALTGCSANVGVGLSVGVPVGNHGHISVGTSRRRW